MGFHVTTKIDGKTVALEEPLPDPFVYHNVFVGWRDLLRGLFRRGLTISVVIHADRETVYRTLATLYPNTDWSRIDADRDNYVIEMADVVKTRLFSYEERRRQRLVADLRRNIAEDLSELRAGYERPE